MDYADMIGLADRMTVEAVSVLYVRCCCKLRILQVRKQTL